MTPGATSATNSTGCTWSPWPPPRVRSHSARLPHPGRRPSWPRSSSPSRRGSSTSPSPPTDPAAYGAQPARPQRGPVVTRPHHADFSVSADDEHTSGVIVALTCGNAEIGVMGSCYYRPCLLYTSDAADDLLCVDLGG